MTAGKRLPARRPPGRDPADLVVGLLFGAVPLLASARAWDQFTTVKWYAVEALAAAWLVVEAFRGGPWRWPTFVTTRYVRAALLALLALALVSLGRGGWGWAHTPLTERATVLALALCAFRYARRGARPLRWPALGSAAAALVTSALGTAQVLGRHPLPWLTSGDGRSALFGNANMAAQFLGWAFVVVLVARPGRGARLGAWLREALLAWTAAYLYFLSCRSVLLGLALAVAVLWALGRVSWRSLLRIGAGAGLLVALLLQLGGGRFLDDARRHKGLGAAQRLAMWESTLAMVGDHPLGVGAANFTHAFPPYHAAGRLARDETVEYRHPHNEPLRVLAEEGVLFMVLAGFVAVRLLAGLSRSRRLRRGRTERGAFLLASGVFLVVEGAFQFPLAVAFGALAAAFWLGLALGALEPLSAGRPRTGGAGAAPAAVLLLAAGGLLAGAAAAARSEYLFVNRPEDLAAQARACALDPRNLPACVTAGWLESKAGRPADARARLGAVLERSPHYGPAVKLLGEVAMAAGEAERGCFYLWLYDSLFHGVSSVHDRLTQDCRPERLASFARRQPVPYFGAFPRDPPGP